jgi:opacity protein-like surface antigen
MSLDAGEILARPISKVISINTESTGLYLGAGVGQMQLTDNYSEEYFRTNPVMFQIGYQFTPYIAVEGRYTRSLTVAYDRGKTPNPNNNDFPTDFTNIGAYLKLIYPYHAMSLYLLLGYGETRLTDIKGADRAEHRFQWGLGASYAMTESYSIFVDYTQLYDGTGFDGRAQKRSVDADMFIIGVSYAF